MKGEMMKKILLSLSFCLIAFQANAGVTCYEDSFGYRHCSGVNSAGETVDIRSHTDSFGYTNTNGRIGDNNYNSRSHTDSFGYTNYDGDYY